MINRTSLLAGCATALLALCSVPALADDGLYVSADGGGSFFLPNLHLKNAPGTARENFGAGYAMGGALGYDNGDGVRIEVDSNYTLNGLDRIDSVAAPGHIDSKSLMLNSQFDLAPHAVVTPYMGAGAGYENVGIDVPGLSGHDWKPAYQAEAGLRGNLSQDVSVFTEYRLTQSAPEEVDHEHQHFVNHGLLAGLTYRLGS
ncbi:MAG TPA: outer membrane beta-barrel protein [Rhizomicrobium sp.]|nr:outer membrane beta-barrel protein [Rhizomicrobium sp.]